MLYRYTFWFKSTIVPVRIARGVATLRLNYAAFIIITTVVGETDSKTSVLCLSSSGERVVSPRFLPRHHGVHENKKSYRGDDVWPRGRFEIHPSRSRCRPKTHTLTHTYIFTHAHIHSLTQTARRISF